MGYAINFYLEKRAALGVKNLPVLIQIIFDGKRYKTTTGQKADHVNDWNASRQLFKSHVTNAGTKNAILKAKKSELESIYLQLLADGYEPTSKMIADHFRNRTPKKDFFSMFDQYINQVGSVNGWSLNTRRHFTIIKNVLFRLRDEIPMEFNAVNYSWYQSLFDALIKSGISNNTIKHYFMCVDMFFRWVNDKHGITIKDFGKFKIKDKAAAIRSDAQNVVYLRPDEFMLMAKARLTGTYAIVRDYFILMASTGLRVSDVLALRRSDVTDDAIRIITMKTKSTTEIPLNEFSRSILKRYEGLPDGMAMPEATGQSLNRILKPLCKQIGLNREVNTATTFKGEPKIEKKPLHEVITNHAARRTFVSLGVALQMDSKTMMQFTTHKTDQMFRHYQGISDKQKTDAMDKFSSKRLLKIV